MRLGKPPEGRITVDARREQDRIVITVRDDGRGFDLEALRNAGLASGRISAATSQRLSREELLNLAFVSGLSTRLGPGDVSGHGVGLDAVRHAMEQLGGVVTLQSHEGQGSCVRLSSPGTASLARVLLVEVGGERVGLPLQRVLSALEVQWPPGPGDASVVWSGEEIPLVALGDLLGWPEPGPGRRPVLVVEGEQGRYAIAVDSLSGREELLLRSPGPFADDVPGLVGAAILGSGRPVVVLDLARLRP